MKHVISSEVTKRDLKGTKPGFNVKTAHV